MLGQHAEAVRSGGGAQDRMRMDEFMCMLEVLQAMSLSPAVMDAAFDLDLHPAACSVSYCHLGSRKLSLWQAEGVHQS